MNFKIGDKVRCIDNSFTDSGAFKSITVGEIYEIYRL